MGGCSRPTPRPAGLSTIQRLSAPTRAPLDWADSSRWLAGRFGRFEGSSRRKRCIVERFSNESVYSTSSGWPFKFLYRSPDRARGDRFGGGHPRAAVGFWTARLVETEIHR